jgi:hypothetical protein
MLKYLRYSGCSVILSLNPLYWKVLPWYRREDDSWESSNTYACGFLFLTIRVWIDNGDW